jgi:hypothetical protein
VNTREVEDMNEMVCGEGFDHDLSLVDERDGLATLECRTCGAELIQECGD